MAHDVILNKVATIERCIKCIHEEYDSCAETFKDNYTKQDSVILNLERLSQATIVIAIVEKHLVDFEYFVKEIFDNYLRD